VRVRPVPAARAGLLGNLARTSTPKVLLMVTPRLRIHGWRAERRVPLQSWPDDPKSLDPHLYVEHDWDPRECEQVLAYLNGCYEAPFMSPGRSWSLMAPGGSWISRSITFKTTRSSRPLNSSPIFSVYATGCQFFQRTDALYVARLPNQRCSRQALLSWTPVTATRRRRFNGT